jgi:hypothetical protein
MGAGEEAPARRPRAPRGMHDVLWPESARWEAFARFASWSRRPATAWR